MPVTEQGLGTETDVDIGEAHVPFAFPSRAHRFATSCSDDV
jgi:hypothetical protein